MRRPEMSPERSPSPPSTFSAIALPDLSVYCGERHSSRDGRLGSGFASPTPPTPALSSWRTDAAMHAFGGFNATSSRKAQRLVANRRRHGQRVPASRRRTRVAAWDCRVEQQRFDLCAANFSSSRSTSGAGWRRKLTGAQVLPLLHAGAHPILEGVGAQVVTEESGDRVPLVDVVRE